MRRSSLAERWLAKLALGLGAAALIFVAFTLFLYATADSLTDAIWSGFRSVNAALFVLYPWFAVGGVFLGLYAALGAKTRENRRRGQLAVGFALLSMVAVLVGKPLF